MQKDRSKFTTKKALLLDMNSTFMFGEDRFGESEDYSKYYKDIGGGLTSDCINSLIADVFDYLEERYPDERYRHAFPSVVEAINKVSNHDLSNQEINNIVNTFAFHEHGYITDEYIDTLFKLKRKFVLSVVIDIWSPKDRWLSTFKKKGIMQLFSIMSFSSDHGVVKPSPKPFEFVVNGLGIAKQNCLVIGDSVRRDLGGAISSGIDCVLVGGACDDRAVACYPDLLTFAEEIL